MTAITIRVAETDDGVMACFPVMAALRPHLVRSEFLSKVRRMSAEGYHLACLSVDRNVEAVAGYRIVEMLRTGRLMEIDDLVTSADARSRGFGKRLFDWCLETARASNCSLVELDSAVHRSDAHRFYFREKMHVLAFHFSRSVRD